MTLKMKEIYHLTIVVKQKVLSLQYEKSKHHIKY